VPGFASANAKSLIEALLNRNPRKRLGTIKGAEEIKKHAFFKGIDWDKIYRREYKLPEPYLKKRFENFLQMSPTLLDNTNDHEQLRKQALDRAN
jgi:hypothetical protein